MPAPVQGLGSSQRLLKSADYQRCYRTGRRRYGALVNLHFYAHEGEGPRLGITASRKVGKSVARHKIKRRIREIYRRWHGRPTLPAGDLVVHVKPGAAEAEFAELRNELERHLAAIRPRAATPSRGRRR